MYMVKSSACVRNRAHTYVKSFEDIYEALEHAAEIEEDFHAYYQDRGYEIRDKFADPNFADDNYTLIMEIWAWEKVGEIKIEVYPL